MYERAAPQRVLLAKVGLDGHDRGVKVVARGLRDAGFHVIYGGLWQKVESVTQAALDEDVDWLGISILNGAHMTLIPQVLESLRRRDLTHVGVIVGGIIPQADQEKLKAMGVDECFRSGVSIETIVDFFSQHRPAGLASRAPTGLERTRESESLMDGLGNITPQETLDYDVPSLVGRLQHGSRAALSRLLTLAAAGHDGASLASALQRLPKESPNVIALTGSGGVGKSSLLGAVAMHFAERGERIGVLACDPESPISGGALLGDRCRIAGAAATERIFIRSLATASGRQGVAQNTEMMLGAMKAYGFDRILVETVGAGQGDVAVRRVADLVVLVLQPQTGDELQWEKAGILEIADIVVVNKSDLPGADQTVAEVTRQLQATSAPGVPVVRTSVARRDGLQELCRVIDSAQASPIKFSVAQHDNS